MRKDPAAVALGRKGGKKGGPARAAKLTPEQRSESARRAVQARWARRNKGRMVVKKTGKTSAKTLDEFQKTKKTAVPTDTSNQAFLTLLRRYKATNDPHEMRRLSEQIERMIFHKQYENA